MRISDWSSDVCSSDLAQPRHRHRVARGLEDAVQRKDAFVSVHGPIMARAGGFGWPGTHVSRMPLPEPWPGSASGPASAHPAGGNRRPCPPVHAPRIGIKLSECKDNPGLTEAATDWEPFAGRALQGADGGGRG